MPVYEVRFKLAKGTPPSAVLALGAQPIALKDTYIFTDTFQSQTDALESVYLKFNYLINLEVAKDTQSSKTPLFGQITVLKLEYIPERKKKLVTSVVLKVYRKSDGEHASNLSIDWEELKAASGIKYGDMVANIENWFNSKAGNEWLADKLMGGPGI